MNGCFTNIHIIYAATVPNLSLVSATLAILVHVHSLHWGHIESSCFMLVYFGFNKLCQKSYSDSQDLPGISRHLSSSFVWFLKKLGGHNPVFVVATPYIPILSIAAHVVVLVRPGVPTETHWSCILGIYTVWTRHESFFKC